MSVIRKKNCVVVVLEEDNLKKDMHVQELIINGSTFSFLTSGNWVTMPISRLIKIKEKISGGGG